MTEPMTDAEVKQAIERHKMNVGWFDPSKKWYASMWPDGPEELGETLTEAVSEVVRQSEEK